MMPSGCLTTNELAYKVRLEQAKQEHIIKLHNAKMHLYSLLKKL